VARIIPDGATLQIGLGRVPNEMLRFLEDRRDLGIHSDVITEPLVDLVERGVVTGARKNLHRHKVVASMAMGTRRLYDLIDGAIPPSLCSRSNT
jgi:4-hydroxybutyrate CoA-transferase